MKHARRPRSPRKPDLNLVPFGVAPSPALWQAFPLPNNTLARSDRLSSTLNEPPAETTIVVSDDSTTEAESGGHIAAGEPEVPSQRWETPYQQALREFSRNLNRYGEKKYQEARTTERHNALQRRKTIFENYTKVSRTSSAERHDASAQQQRTTSPSAVGQRSKLASSSVPPPDCRQASRPSRPSSIVAPPAPSERMHQRKATSRSHQQLASPPMNNSDTQEAPTKVPGSSGPPQFAAYAVSNTVTPVAPPTSEVNATQLPLSRSSSTAVESSHVTSFHSGAVNDVPRRQGGHTSGKPDDPEVTSLLAATLLLPAARPLPLQPQERSVPLTRSKSPASSYGVSPLEHDAVFRVRCLPAPRPAFSAESIITEVQSRAELVALLGASSSTSVAQLLASSACLVPSAVLDEVSNAVLLRDVLRRWRLARCGRAACRDHRKIILRQVWGRWKAKAAAVDSELPHRNASQYELFDGAPLLIAAHCARRAQRALLERYWSLWKECRPQGAFEQVSGNLLRGAAAWQAALDGRSPPESK